VNLREAISSGPRHRQNNWQGGRPGAAPKTYPF